MPQYNPNEIEQKWQRFWEKNETFKATENPEKPPYYVLDMFPYPSGAGLHVGHPLGYIASDIVARFKRNKQFEVLHPMGYDAFGLPAEQFAIDTGNHPEGFTDKNIARYEDQMKKIGLSFDWSRKVKTSDPKFYKWTQWIFIQLFESWYNPKTNCAEHINDLIRDFEKNGNTYFTAEQWNNFSEAEQQKILMDYRLAYIGESEVNWCEALGTVLANEEVKDGVSERGGYPVEKRKMRQWFLRITAYADRLLQDLNDIDWPQAVKDMQTNWIGKSVGAEVDFRLTPGPSPMERGEMQGTFVAENTEDGRSTSDSGSPLPGRGAGGEANDPGYMTSDKTIWGTLKTNARTNRKEQTEAEQILWEALRNSKMGFKFRRQHAIDKYIADFVCLEKKLIVEVDGEIHNSQKEQDEFRTSILNQIGFDVIRFTNEEVINDLENVLIQIKERLNLANGLTPGHSPMEGGGMQGRFGAENTEDVQSTSDSGSPLSGRGAGGEAKIRIFTTRPDTIFGASFMVLAPEHELVSVITSQDQKSEVEKYVAQAKLKSERERKAETKVSGVFSGAYAINPFTRKEIPIWIADYVLGDYGTGAIMAVPGHDSRDWAFAKHFNLPIIEVVEGGNVEEASYDAKEGYLVNSDFLNGLLVDQAIKRAINEIELDGLGKMKTNYRLRDANFSRQRYWGEPFPIVYKNGLPYPVPFDALPVELPEVESYKPTGSGESPLASVDRWVNTPDGRRETNTMPGWAGSSWYYLRYMDPDNDFDFVDKDKERYWKNVDFYIGGAEHATGHLLYSRFWNKFLFDRGLVSTKEPFKKLINQGMIQGVSQKISLDKRINDQGIENYYFISSELLKDDTREIHVDVSLVDNSILDIDAFIKWRTDYKDFIFKCEGGFWQNGNFTKTGEGSDQFRTKSEVEKMSKSKYNVINPDEVIEKYGCDAFRMYEMFLGPIEQSKPWDTKGIDGVSRFLKRFWGLFYDRDGNWLVNEDKPNAEELKTLHKTIKKIEDDIERFNLNTCVSSLMIAVNDLGGYQCHKKEILEPLVILISPFAPHIAEELWEKLGNSLSVAYAPYPAYIESYTAENSFEYPVSVNGKLRAKIELPLSLSKEQVEDEIKNMDLSKWTDGNPLKKIIVVPGKIVNVVV